jgi:hypothetical protein
MFPPDGKVVFCGNGALNQYVPNLQHGALCGLGIDATITTRYTVTNPNNPNEEPYFDSSDVQLYLGTSFLAVPNQQELFACQVKQMQIACSRNLQSLEPWGVGIGNHQCQEHSGPWSVEFVGCAGSNYYAVGTVAQNSLATDVQDLGVANFDYKQAFRWENAPFRGVFGGTPHAGGLNSQWLSRDAIRIYSPGWQGFETGGVVLSESEEAVLDGIETENAQILVLGSSSTPTTNRRPLNNVHFGPYTAASKAQALTWTSPTCGVQDDSLYGFSTGCITPGQNKVADYNQKDVTEYLPADVTTSGGTPGTAGLFSFAKTSVDQGTWDLTCHITYTQATAGNGVGISGQSAIAAATTWTASGVVQTGAAAVATGNSGAVTTNAITPIVTSAAGPLTPNFGTIDITGTVQIANTGTQFNVIGFTANVADAVTFKATISWCRFKSK